MKEIQKVVKKLSREQESAAAVAVAAAAAASSCEPVKKHKVTPGIPGWLDYDRRTEHELMADHSLHSTVR